MRKRSRARKLALQALYQAWYNPLPIQKLIDQFYQQHQKVGAKDVDWDFFAQLVRGSLAHAEASDAAFGEHLVCRIDQLDATERQLLRLATYELNHHIESPTLSVIDDAVHLAKSFGGTDSYKLINAVLDKLVRTMPLRAGGMQTRPEEA